MHIVQSTVQETQRLLYYSPSQLSHVISPHSYSDPSSTTNNYDMHCRLEQLFHRRCFDMTQ